MAPASRIRGAFGALTRGLPRPFWFLWSGLLVTRAGSFVLPFLSLYLTQGLRLPYSQAGATVALYGAGGAISGPLGGYLADRCGRRLTMLLSLGLSGVGMIALGMAHRLEVIAPAIFLLALVSEMYRPAMQAAVADLVAPSDRVRAFGIIYWVINMGFAIGLTLGGLVASRSFTWLFVGDGATTLLCALLVALGVPETRPAPAPRAERHPAGSGLRSAFVPFHDAAFVAFLMLNFLLIIVFMQNATTFPVDMAAHGISKPVYGRVLALNGLLIVLTQPFLGPFLARRDRSRTLAAGAALMGLGFGLNAFARTELVYAVAVIIWTTGEMGVLPVSNALVADLAPVELRGRYQGAHSLSFGLAACVAPLLGLFALERLGTTGLWMACLAVGCGVACGHLAIAPALRRLRAARLAAAAPIGST